MEQGVPAGPARGGSGGTWYLGLGWPVLKGPGRVQVYVLSFGIAPLHRNQTSLQQKYQSAYSVLVMVAIFATQPLLGHPIVAN